MDVVQAFASQFLYCQKKLELDPEKINVNGGAMAIGHPLGATGTFIFQICLACVFLKANKKYLTISNLQARNSLHYI